MLEDYMDRKVYKELLKWKESDTRKPLLLLGARQVGKTWLMKEFGRNEYDNVVYINCDTQPLAAEIFQKDYDIKRLIVTFQAISGETITEGKTLIILDEIQEVTRGLHSLKYFCEEANGYHVMAAGSLLGVTLSQQESFPVGKVDMLKVYPMDFDEFLMALNLTHLVDLLHMQDYSLLTSFAAKLEDYLNQYYFVGGMPEVVANYVKNQDLKEVRRLQNLILESYRKDISKHTSKIESVRIGQVISSLPSQLAKENKKFIYGAAKKGGRAADFELAIQWLSDAGLIYRIPQVSKIAMPLKFYERIENFKLFWLDVGLLNCMAEVSALALIVDHSQLVEYKGMVAEQFVAQQLISNGMNLYYWSNDKSPSEIDFVMQYEDSIYPIEVKSGRSVQGRSLTALLQRQPELHGLRFSLLPYCQQDTITNIPLYALPSYL